MIAVLAGNRREFDEFLTPWVSGAQRRKFTYVGRATDAMGCAFTDIIKIGNWRRNLNLYELESICNHRLKGAQ